ncbi:MAG: serine protease [Desulfobacteraceae bacterium]|nr:serine protease [Desulfobacteraceae bacterium]MCF8094963.1 serine protease [Desulfobacteraceae bacterium]
MQSYIVPVILQIAGVAVLLAEVMLPSGGLLTIIAAGCLGYSLYMVFSGISVFTGMVFVMADIVILPVILIAGLKLLARSPFALKSELSSKSGYASYNEKTSDYLGKEGTAATNLRPAGTALIEGKRVDVVTRGDYIEKGSRIKVNAVEGGRIVVKKIR